jgi:hypothetical protein
MSTLHGVGGNKGAKMVAPGSLVDETTSYMQRDW